MQVQVSYQVIVIYRSSLVHNSGSFEYVYAAQLCNETGQILE